MIQDSDGKKREKGIMKYPRGFNLEAVLALVLACHPTMAAEPTSAQDLISALEAQEIYVEFYPRDMMVKIREYGISTTLAPEVDVNKQADLIAQLVAAADYCEQRFAIPGYLAGQEVLFATDSPRGVAVHVECVLVTADAAPQAMEAVYTSVLRRPVTISEERREVRLAFATPDLEVGPNNAEQLLGRNENKEAMLIWRARERTFEAVFINTGKPRGDFRGIAPFVSQVPVSSPVLDKEKVDALRASLRSDSE